MKVLLSTSGSSHAESSRLPKTWPHSVNCGDVRVKIYRTTSLVRGKTYPTFTLSYFANGHRQRRQFTQFNEAKREALRIAEQKAQGALGAAGLSAADRVALQEALTLLAKSEGTGTATTARLVQIVRDYTSATHLLPKGASLTDCVQYFAAKHPSNMVKRSVAEVVAEFIADRQSALCSSVHIHDLKTRLAKQFAPHFVMRIDEVSPVMVQKWLNGLTHKKTGAALNPRSRENLLRMIIALFNFARRMKYVSAELALEIAEIPAPKKQHAPIGIYEPSDIAKILACADSEIVPAVAIAAFAGLRLAEIARLEWKEVRLADRLIVVEANKAKTAARRLVPISDNLAAWLANHVRSTGFVSPCLERLHNVGNALGDRIERAAARAKVAWKRNGFRHSYITYRVAVKKDVPAVALECGNSPSVIFANYRALSTEAEALAWFGVMPPSSGAVILPLPPGSREVAPLESSPAYDHDNPKAMELTN